MPTPQLRMGIVSGWLGHAEAGSGLFRFLVGNAQLGLPTYQHPTQEESSSRKGLPVKLGREMNARKLINVTYPPNN